MDGDLNQMLLNYKNGMPTNLIRKIFLQINSGLKIMIENGKCHRDLKPSNILYSFTNEKKTDFIIKIGDFGLSTDLESTTTDLTDAGTDWFKAPEVEERKYSNKCDLYSIGIILYKLKTGEYIFDGKNKFEILKNKHENNIKKETDDPKLNNLIKKLVVINPHKRMEWNDYFKDPFFKVNDEKIKENEEEDNEEDRCKVVLIGEQGVKKTSIIQRFLLKDKFSIDLSTTCSSYNLRSIYLEKENRTIKFEIWDTPGQEKYRSLAKVFFRDAQVCILIYDKTRKTSFEEIKNYWYEEIKNNASDNVIFALVGHFAERIEFEEVSEEEGRAYAMKINAIFQEIKSKGDEELIYELFEMITQKFVESETKIYENRGDKLEKSKLKKLKNNNKNKKKCI